MTEPRFPPIEEVIVPRTRDLGDGFHVRRALPSTQRRMVGPFVFFDQMGPTTLAPGRGLDVRPHPHIGLATVTYLFDGEILHRDSLGTVQPIRPGAVNWMTAGHGIVHSERTPPQVREAGSSLFGIQIWVALPKIHEETEPTFSHHAAEQLPVIDDDGVTLRVIVGSVAGARSPVPTLSEMFYADAVIREGSRVIVRPEHEERAAYVISGRVQVGDAMFEPGQMLVLRAGAEIAIAALAPSRVLLFGGEPMDGPRKLWWNFVASTSERIERAKADWRAGRLGSVPGETEFIPLPDEPPQPVAYP